MTFLTAIIQRHPIVRIPSTKFDASYTAYKLYNENSLSRGTFKLSMIQDSASNASTVPTPIPLNTKDYSISSLNRLPNEKLYLVTKNATQNVNSYWNFPTMHIKDFKTITTPQNSIISFIKEGCNNPVNIHSVGNSPIATRSDSFGNIFYYLIEMLPPYSYQPMQKDHIIGWFSKQELATQLDPNVYRDIIDSII